MSSSRRLDVVVLLVAAAVLVACKDSPAVSTVRAQLEREIPGAEFEKEFHLRLGGMSLGLGKKLAGWALADDEELSQLMKSVKRVDIGTYRVVSLPPLEQVEPPSGLMSTLGRSGWSLMLRSQDDGERIWIFVRQDEEGGLRNIYVVSLDEVELTMVSLEGRLDELLADAIAGDPGGFLASVGS